MTPEEHLAYLAYNKGDHSPAARAGKAAYTRAYRALKASQAAANGQRPIVGITHGLSGYQEHHCRCMVCRGAKGDYQHTRRIIRKGQ